MSANSSILPEYTWVYAFHTAYVKKEFGSFGGPDAAKKASAKVDEFNKKLNKELAKFKQLPNVETVVAKAFIVKTRLILRRRSPCSRRTP